MINIFKKQIEKLETKIKNLDNTIGNPVLHFQALSEIIEKEHDYIGLFDSLVKIYLRTNSQNNYMDYIIQNNEDTPFDEFKYALNSLSYEYTELITNPKLLLNTQIHTTRIKSVLKKLKKMAYSMDEENELEYLNFLLGTHYEFGQFINKNLEILTKVYSQYGSVFIKVFFFDNKNETIEEKKIYLSLDNNYEIDIAISHEIYSIYERKESKKLNSYLPDNIKYALFELRPELSI